MHTRTGTQVTTSTGNGRRRGRRLLLALTTMTTTLAGVTATAPVGAHAASPAVVADTDWLGVVNAYRAMSGLEAVREDPAWSAQGRDHSCYMLRNGMAHDEVPGKPGYTAGGDLAGNSGNVAVSSDVNAVARRHVELWMTGPFHAIGILRPGLRTTGFGMCADATTPTWHSGATLDVIRGLDPKAPRRTTPVLFPGPGATVTMGAFVTESPDPMALCGWTGTAGLPLIAMMPSRVRNATTTLSGPAGPIETCTLHAGNTAADAHAQSLLDGDNAVVVMPRAKLAPGTYTASVTSDGGSAAWTFTVDPKAVLVAQRGVDVPDTTVTGAPSSFEPATPIRRIDTRTGLGGARLRAGQRVRLQVADGAATAVSANFTVDRPAGPGFLTVDACTPNVPVVSTLNFTTSAVPNQAVVPLAGGALCAVSSVDTDLLVDVNGTYRAGGSTGYVALAPRRLVDTRSGERLAAGEVRRVQVEGVEGGPGSDASAIAVNLTAVGPSGDGFLSAFPCDVAGSDVSNLNVVAGRDRANAAVVPTAADGSICVQSTVATDLVVDVTGAFVPGAGMRMRTLDPVRLLDTRSPAIELNPATAGTPVAPGQVVRVQVAGTRGVPADAKVAVVNVTAVEPGRAGFVTVTPCGTTATVSTLNTDTAVPAIANGATVTLDAQGALCLTADHPVHLLVDISGVWS